MDHVAGDIGFEPMNDGVKVRCLTAWRIPKALLERVKRIELSQPAWKAGALPLSYTRRQIGGGRRIRTFEIADNGFTVRPLWPLGNPSTIKKRKWSR